MGAGNRRSDRREVRFKLVYDDGESFNTGLVRDLTMTGVFLETAMPLSLGQTVTLSSLALDPVLSFALRARVARVVQSHPYDTVSRMGLVFENPTPEQRGKLKTLIREMEEDAARAESELDPYLGQAVVPPPPPDRTPSIAPSPPKAAPGPHSGSRPGPRPSRGLTNPGAPVPKELFERASENISEALQVVVTETGQAFEDTVLVDEAAVSPLLMGAKLRTQEVAKEPENAGQKPLDSAEFEVSRPEPTVSDSDSDWDAWAEDSSIASH